MIKILHLADLHLGRSHSYLGDKAPDRRREADGILRRVVDCVLGEQPDIRAVVIAGDLFDSYRPDETLVGEVMDWLRSLVEAGRTVITLPGNHDELSYPDCVYWRRRDRWPGVLVTSPEWTKVATVKTGEGPCHFYGLAYRAGMTPETLEPKIPREPDGLHVAILHASVDLPGEDRSIRASSGDLARLGVDYVALGHVHKPREFRFPSGPAVYPGLIEGSGFDDSGCRELTIATLEGQSSKVERIPIEARRIETRTVDLGEFDEREVLMERLGAMADPDLILRIVLSGTAGFEVSPGFLTGQLSSLFHHLQIEEDFTVMNAGEVEAAAGEETVFGWVLRELRQREAQAEEVDRAVIRRALRHAWQAFRGGGGC